MHKRLAVVLTVTLCPVAGWTAGVWHASTSALVRPVRGAAPSLAPAPQPLLAPDWASLPTPLIEGVPNEERRDLYGNDVLPAVAHYSHDAAGAVREEHSPATEVARLKPPTT
ncbi:MAG: hypothetical protein ABL982_04885 [Vicinamibacterales bacterium]